MVRQPYANRRLLPDFLIIGAQKSGTTSLHLALSQHPAVQLAFKREVHYFDWNFDRRLEWYRAHFPTRRTRDRSLQRYGEFATGEKSPYYLFDPAVPARVRAILPDVKLIVLLRDPVSRAYSHFHQATRRGIETLSFQEALASEARQVEAAHRPLAGHPHRRSYLARGRYAEQLERWLVHFNREQIHVTLSERFFADPVEVVGQIHEFIGVTRVQPRGLIHWGQAAYRPLSPTLRGELQHAFADDVAKLESILGEDPGWW